MKKLTVIAAGLGYRLLERSGRLKAAGLDFSSRASVFPAVTCVAQATLRTALTPAEHGMYSNAFWSRDFNKPVFWEQNAKLVKGRRVWSERRAAGAKVGLFFLQQSLGEEADVIVSPAPIHKHGGGMMMSCYTKPTAANAELERRLGKFPLWRYWGPLASPRVGRRCIDWMEAMTEISEVDEAYLYLPTLDYAAQKHGPDSPEAAASLAEFVAQLERIVGFCERRSAGLTVVGDYEITPVSAESVRPNVILRREGYFHTRTVGGRAYPDFHQSTAFAVCDHEVALVYGERREAAAKTLLASGGWVRTDTALGAEGPLVLLAAPGSWCDYAWWTDKAEAPDFASHVDIHNKPGFDPRELFFFNRGTVRGTHGRSCEVAYTEV